MLGLMVLYTVGGLAALAGLAALLAHGGVGGAIVEALLVLSIAGIFLAVYLRERHSGSPARRRRHDGGWIRPQDNAVFGQG